MTEISEEEEGVLLLASVWVDERVDDPWRGCCFISPPVWTVQYSVSPPPSKMSLTALCCQHVAFVAT